MVIIRAAAQQNQQNDMCAQWRLSPGIRAVWSIFAVRSRERFLHADSENWSDWASAHTDLNVCWAHVILSCCSSIIMLYKQQVAQWATIAHLRANMQHFTAIYLVSELKSEHSRQKTTFSPLQVNWKALHSNLFGIRGPNNYIFWAMTEAEGEVGIP